MIKIRLRLSYFGYNYYGWQRQKQAVPTIQESIESALTQIMDQAIKVTASGRTDRGTHALNQWAHCHIPEGKTHNLIYRLNSMLGDSIKVHTVEEAPVDFHALHSALSKMYIYKIDNQAFPNPFLTQLSHHYPYKLSLEKLNSLADPFLGTHDFKSFQSRGTPVASTVRTIYKSYWTQNGNMFQYNIVGSGFLKQMVRNIVGTQLEGLKTSQEPLFIEKIIGLEDRTKAAAPVPAHGLYLKWVKYPSELDNKCRKL